MVAISLTHDNVKEMANRLRQFLAAGGTSIKQTHAYEALAKCFGYRDWNTLAGALQSPAPDMPRDTQPRTPTALLLIDRHAMVAHGVTVAQIESAFRRDYPAMLDNRSQWETLCYEQLPLRELPRFSPPVVSFSLRAPDKTHFHDALMGCFDAVVQPKWVFAEDGGGGTHKFTLVFFPEQDAEKLLPALREALTRLPAEITVSTIEKIEPDPDHPTFGKWRSDGVSYFVWAWEVPLPDMRQLASIALKFNGDTLIRLRDVATLHAGVRGVSKPEK